MHVRFVGGAPSSWDIERYALGLNVQVLNAERCPVTMVPFGRTSDGASCELVAHHACYRVLYGVIGAARADEQRAAAFAAAHPTALHTRQAAAAGLPKPVVHILQPVGTAQKRVAPDAAHKAAALAAEAGIAPDAAVAAAAEQPAAHATTRQQAVAVLAPTATPEGGAAREPTAVSVRARRVLSLFELPAALHAPLLGRCA